MLPTDAGGWRQINLCAQPLINTLFGLEDAERDIDFDATRPCEDRVRYGQRIVQDTAAVVTAMGPVDDPQVHAERLRDTLRGWSGRELPSPKHVRRSRAGGVRAGDGRIAGSPALMIGGSARSRVRFARLRTKP